MARKSVKLKDYFEDLMTANKIDIFFGGKQDVTVVELESHEEAAIKRCFRHGLRLIKKISDELAEILEPQEELFIRWGEVAKGNIDENKPITFPATSGTIGVNWLIPQAVKYVATASADNPAYTNYANNKWEMTLSAGSAAYIFGDGTNFYKACPASNQKCFLVIAQHGVIEIGSTPKINLMKIWTQGESKYTYWSVHPLVDVPIEVNDEEKKIHVYNTVGMVPVYNDFGIQWELIPVYSGTSVIPLIGLFFFEYDFMENKKYIS